MQFMYSVFLSEDGWSPRVDLLWDEGTAYSHVTNCLIPSMQSPLSLNFASSRDDHA